MFIDDLINKLLEQRFKRLGIKGYEEYFAAREKTKDDPDVTYIADNIDRIHNNTSTLLTHISAMIAALGILLLFDKVDDLRIFIFFEIVLYTTFAIVCIYNLRYRDFKEIEIKFEKEEFMKKYYFNYLRRRYIYIISTNGVLVTTIIFFMTIVWRLFVFPP